MGADSKIEWTTHTFNPWRGPHGTRVKTSEAYWRQPIKWNRDASCCCRKGLLDYQHEAGCPQHERPRVFCASLADVFEEWQGPISSRGGEGWIFYMAKDDVAWFDQPGSEFAIEKNAEIGNRPLTMDDLRRELFSLIDATPHLDWLILTKRPENVRRMWASMANTKRRTIEEPYRANCWLGTSISDQATADAAIPELLKVRDLCPVLFLSAEPLLGPIDFIRPVVEAADECIWDEAHEWGGTCELCGGEGFREYNDAPDEWGEDCPSEVNHLIPCRGCAELDRDKRLRVFRKTAGNFWLIIGGESGHGARPCRTEWIRSLVNQCAAAGVACFVKQLGSRPLMTHAEWAGSSAVKDTWTAEPSEAPIGSWPVGRVKLAWDSKGGDPDEWPDDLRVRQFPNPERPPNDP